MRGPEDGNGDDQKSVICFLVNKTFNHFVRGGFFYCTAILLYIYLKLR